MPESWRTRLMRWGFNWSPRYRGTGAWITYIASDGLEVRVRIPLSWRTRNFVGTLWGGTMYGALDGFYMVMLIKALGPDYAIWDKVTTMRFRRPAREQLYATCRITAEELAAIRADVERAGKVEREYTVELKSAAGEVHATCQQLVSIKRRRTDAPPPPNGVTTREPT